MFGKIAIGLGKEKKTEGVELRAKNVNKIGCLVRGHANLVVRLARWMVTGDIEGVRDGLSR